MVDKEKVKAAIQKMEKEDAMQRDNELPKEKRWRSISRDVAEAINLLARSCNAKKIVEIGTSQGYSTLWLALAARSTGGKITTFEVEKWRQEAAIKNITDAGLQDYVDFVLENPIQNPSSIPDHVDFVFIDAEKSDYLDHFNTIFDKLRPGGTVVADNAISHFADLREYINHVRMGEKTSSVMFPLGKGLEVTYKFMEKEKDKNLYNDLIR